MLTDDGGDGQCPVEERRALLGPDNKDTVLYAPAEDGVMFRMNELCYNDAEWLMKSIQVGASQADISLPVGPRLGSDRLTWRGPICFCCLPGAEPRQSALRARQAGQRGGALPGCALPP